jgi:saccharopine dehydrogenase-like NADP-dependent oxidoreductase
VGALRVEVSGWRDGVEETVIYAAVDRPSLAAGTLAAVVATASSAPVGASGLAERSYARALLQELARRGVKAAVYDPSTD